MLLNLIKHQRPDIDKICLNVKDPLESKYQLLINGKEKLGIKALKYTKVFTDYSQLINDMLMKIWTTLIQQRKGEYL